MEETESRQNAIPTLEICGISTCATGRGVTGQPFALHLTEKALLPEV